MATYAVIDRCPVPVGLAAVVAEAKRRGAGTLQSCYRGDDARGVLNRFGKHSQFQLYWGWVHRLPGYNPANPPGYSTHEKRNDGAAYPGLRRGAPLPDEWCGMDWGSGAHAVSVIRALGIACHQTYPGSAREQQHVNLTQRLTARWKTFRLPLPPLRGGSRGPRVRVLVIALQQLGYLPHPLGHPLSYFGGWVNTAVARFQHAHGLKTDSVVGPATRTAVSHAIALGKAQGTLQPHS